MRPRTRRPPLRARAGDDATHRSGTRVARVRLRKRAAHRVRPGAVRPTTPRRPRTPIALRARAGSERAGVGARLGAGMGDVGGGANRVGRRRRRVTVRHRGDRPAVSLPASWAGTKGAPAGPGRGTAAARRVLPRRRAETGRGRRRVRARPRLPLSEDARTRPHRSWAAPTSGPRRPRRALPCCLRRGSVGTRRDHGAEHRVAWAKRLSERPLKPATSGRIVKPWPL